MALFASAFKQDKCRSGKWTDAEVDYAQCLITEYRAGALDDVQDGTSLRGYLALKLQCHVKRISKKFENTTYNGKLQYTKNSGGLPDEEVASRRAKLESLRNDFLDSIRSRATQHLRAPLEGAAAAPPSFRAGNGLTNRGPVLQYPPSRVVGSQLSIANREILFPSTLPSSSQVVSTSGMTPMQAAVLGHLPGSGTLPLSSYSFATQRLAALSGARISGMGTTGLPLAFSGGHLLAPNTAMVAMENRLRRLDQLRQEQQHIEAQTLYSLLSPTLAQTTTAHHHSQGRSAGIFADAPRPQCDDDPTRHLVFMGQQEQHREQHREQRISDRVDVFGNDLVPPKPKRARYQS